MRRFLPAPIRGIFALTLYTLNLSIGVSILFVLFLVYMLLPLRKIREQITATYYYLPPIWNKINRAIRRYISGVQLEITLPDDLSLSRYYLVTANHQSWADILILFDIFSGRIPMLKYFLKKQLRWLPFVGQASWLYGYPFLSRHTKTQLAKHPEWKGKDFEATRKACERFKTRPGSLVAFAEGTRFTPAKHARQHSPYANLLKPRAGGIALALQCTDNYIKTLLDVTIVYPPRLQGFWDYCCGNTYKVIAHVRELTLTPALRGDYENDPAYRSQFQQFINTLWQEKQRLFNEYQQKIFSVSSSESLHAQR